MTDASTNAPPTPLTLTPGGEREVVTEEKAIAIIAQWKSQLQSHRSAHPTLSTLCNKIVLSDKSYTIEAAKQIAAFLTSDEEFNPPIATGIEIADLKDIIASRMEEEGLQVLKTLSDAFMSSASLVEVDLSDNAMGSKGVTQCETVLGKKSTLERLSLCNNGLSEYSMGEIADLLTSNCNAEDSGEAPPTCIAQNLTKIHFFNNMSGNEGCKAFKRIMDQCTAKLTDIRFSSTRARREGSSYIASALNNLAESDKLKNVTNLDLCDNSFAECYADLASALSNCGQLESLNLKDCVLSDDGVKEVCSALLKANPPLKCIHLSGNELTPDGAKAVAKLVKKFNKILYILDVEENELTSVGIKRIVRKIDSKTLKKLLLNENECGDIGATAVLECADRIPNLECIEFDRNNFSDEMVDQLMEKFNEKLVEMEDNFGEDDDEDDEEESEDEEEEKEEEKPKDSDLGIDALTDAMSKTGI